MNLPKKLSTEEKKIICDFFELLFTRLVPFFDEPIFSKADALEVNPKNRLIPVTQWNKYYDWPSVPGLRHLIFYQDTNGFKNCIRRAGRRILIDEKAFFEWIENNPRT